MDWEIARQYKIHIDDGDVPKAIEFVSSQLRALPSGPFHLALDLGIADEPRTIADWMETCLAEARLAEPVRAVYLGLNGFEINPDLWFFQFFAFSEDPGIDDAASLENWHWCSPTCCALEGLEPLQRVFAEQRSQIGGDAAIYASLLVLLKFFALVQAATTLLAQRDFPVMAGAANGEDKLVIP